MKIIPEEPDRWLEPEKYKKAVRLAYIKRMKSHIPNRCPNCKTPLTVEGEQIVCLKCGLVTQDSYDYDAGMKYRLPHGIKLM